MQKSIALIFTNSIRLEDIIEALKKLTIATRKIKHFGIKLTGNVQEPTRGNFLNTPEKLKRRLE